MEHADPGTHHAARAGQIGHPLDVLAHLPAGRGRDELNELVVPGQHVEQRGELGVVGLAAGHRPLVPVFVEAERGGHGGGAGRERVVEQRGDPGPLLLGRGPVPGRVAHHVGAEHVVPDHPGHVQREAAELLGRGEILAVTLPAPRDGHIEHLGRQVLDVAQQFLQPLPVPGADRGQRQGAVPDQDGRHPVLRHRVAQRIPEDRRVEMRVDVDEARRDVAARRVDHPLAVRPQAGPDRRDPAVADPDVGRVGRGARAVHDQAAAYQQIVHKRSPRIR